MKFSFRLTILGILLGLIIATVLILGTTSFFNARSTARDLAQQVLDQTSARIDREVTRLLAQAVKPNEISAQFIEAGWLKTDDAPGLIAYWQRMMFATPELTGTWIGIEQNGASVGIARLKKDQFRVWRSSPDAKPGEFTIEEFALEDYPRKSDSRGRSPDIRTRPWYVAAKGAGHSLWTEAYPFLGFAGSRDKFGATYATPVFRSDESFEGVLAADFDLGTLSRFLRSLQIAENGFAFLVELGADGAQHVIAHPDETILLRHATNASGPNKNELVPLAESADGRVPQFMAQLKHVTVDPSTTLEMFRFAHDGTTYLGTARMLEGEHMPRWLIATVIPENDILANVRRNNLIALGVGLLAALLAIGISLYVSSQVARPLEHLVHETERIGRMQIESRPVLHSVVVEVDRMATAVEDMKTGLRSFQKYVPSEIVRSVVQDRAEAALGGERRVVTTLFCDIVDFTSHAETMSPEELVDRLHEYLTALTDEIVRHEGTVDKYIGDAVMAFWGAPQEHPQQALAACQAALAIQARLAELRERWQGEGKAPFFARVGINTGDVIAGNIGSEARLSYTIVGDAVNLASRLEGLNKQYGTSILIAESTRVAAADAIVARPLDWVSVKGKAAPVLIFELLSLKSAADPNDEPWLRLSTAAFERYREQSWEEAVRLYGEALRLRPGDQASARLLARCQARLAAGDEPWDGIERIQEK